MIPKIMNLAKWFVERQEVKPRSLGTCEIQKGLSPAGRRGRASYNPINRKPTSRKKKPDSKDGSKAERRTWWMEPPRIEQGRVMIAGVVADRGVHPPPATSRPSLSRGLLPSRRVAGPHPLHGRHAHRRARGRPYRALSLASAARPLPPPAPAGGCKVTAATAATTASSSGLSPPRERG